MNPCSLEEAAFTCLHHPSTVSPCGLKGRLLPVASALSDMGCPSETAGWALGPSL